ncbi:MAG: hypothetical protein FWG07_01905 [Treponema sp.]|nr:hypothetical protein [Treponema sp.]
MTREKTLILRCIPFMEKGVGSAWGLPVIAAGKERLSALSLSEQLQAPGMLAFDADPFRAEHLRELEALGIGPLGRYLGGEPIKPVRLGPEDFFNTSINRRRIGERTEKTGTIKSAELFCTGLEFEKTYWIANGSVPDLFTGHLEFLRTWGFSGGLSINESALAQLLAGYLIHLQKETSKEKPKIAVLISKHFFETQLYAQLPNLKISGDPDAGEIPVNFCTGHVPVLSREMTGLGIVLYEDIVPMLRTQKACCDILIAVNTGSSKKQHNYSVFTEEISAGLKLTINAEGKEKHKAGAKKEISSKTYLFRDCRNGTLQFPAHTKIDSKPIRFYSALQTKNQQPRTEGRGIRPLSTNQISREEASGLELFPQWETHRAEKVHGCLFAINAKFSGLHAADFKEEQVLFYHEGPGTQKSKQTRAPPVKLAPPVQSAPPPIKPNASFIGLNQTQLEFFFQWRSECRRGNVRIMPDSMYMETYIILYAEELALCMGKEGSMQHFTALMHLFLACIEYYPETAMQLCKFCVDFAIIYGIGAEAFPILLHELVSNGWFNEIHNEIAGTEMLLLDMALYYFFIEAENNLEKKEYWPLIKKLIPHRLLKRKENDSEFPSRFCQTLETLDTQLRQDWNRSFFMLFFPPLLQSCDCNAFESGRVMGNSSYTVLRPGFSTHKPLIDILAALTLTPECNPLPGVKTCLHPLSLENELLEELRKESNAVREMLTMEDYSLNGQNSVYHGRNRAGSHRPKRIEHQPKALNQSTYIPVDKINLTKFITSLGTVNRKALESIIRAAHDPALKHTDISDTTIDEINSAFYEQFGDLIIEIGSEEPSISAEYAVILGEWG